MTDERTATAIHEAAHAVIARRLGLVAGGATIERDKDSAGHVEIADPHSIAWQWEQRGHYRDLRLAFRGRIIAYMAGAEAVRVLLGVEVDGDGDDRLQIEMMAQSRYSDLPGDLWERAEQRMRRQTRRLVRRHRLAIERVAAALVERGTVQPEEIDDLAG